MKNLLFGLCFFVFVSCGQKRFDKVLWATYKAGVEYGTFRDEMLVDLTTNNKLKGIKYSELVELLGEPDYKGEEENEIKYEILIDYGRDIDPVYTKDLIFVISSDSLVTSWDIKEWKH